MDQKVHKYSNFQALNTQNSCHISFSLDQWIYDIRATELVEHHTCKNIVENQIYIFVHKLEVRKYRETRNHFCKCDIYLKEEKVV